MRKKAKSAKGQMKKPAASLGKGVRPRQPGRMKKMKRGKTTGGRY